MSCNAFILYLAIPVHDVKLVYLYACSNPYIIKVLITNYLKKETIKNADKIAISAYHHTIRIAASYNFGRIISICSNEN